jgi:hypothetical protein
MSGNLVAGTRQDERVGVEGGIAGRDEALLDDDIVTPGAA